jgi:feruloyl esterase
MAFITRGYWANMVYEKPEWDYKTFMLDSGLPLAEEKTAKALDAVDLDLKPFKARGGKLILYHGWNDPAIPAPSTVNYYENVRKKMGHDADSFVRLYMLPGVQHCGGGPGPDSFKGVGSAGDPQHNMNAALEQWVEKGEAPSTIIASKHAANDRQHIVMTRPLCPYPQAAKYKGSGDTNDAANFVCRAGKK